MSKGCIAVPLLAIKLACGGSGLAMDWLSQCETIDNLATAMDYVADHGARPVTSKEVKTGSVRMHYLALDLTGSVKHCAMKSCCASRCGWGDAVSLVSMLHRRPWSS
jgi:hypothetical protein